MESLEEKQIPHSEDTHGESLVKKVTGRKSRNSVYDKRTLKRVLKYLSKQKKKKRTPLAKEACPGGDLTDFKVDRQVKLRCRQLPNVCDHLRRAIMRQDWDESTTLVTILCHPGLKYYSSIIMKVCFILLLNHPNSSLGLMQKFIRLTTDYVLEEDVNKFIKILFVLRKESLKPLASGKYTRKTGDYKVTRDLEFEQL